MCIRDRLNGIVVDEAEPTHPCSGEVERSGRAQTASTDDEHTGLAKPALPLNAHVGQAEVSSMSSDVNHDSPTQASHIKETASVDVLFEPFLYVNGG